MSARSDNPRSTAWSLPPRPSQADIGARIGKYELVRKLAMGGMAEVFLAKFEWARGLEKTVVVKRILAHLAEDPNFVAMFLSEARLASQLNHPNIAQIIEFGESDGVNFLVMEYVDGPSLRSLARAFRDRGEWIPFPHCARIVAAACEALAHAHQLLDPLTGQPLQLVHRDVSPDNILISRGGAVKLVDFGIAKAITQAHHTKPGTVKGKLSYMAPEQLKAQPLDRRADVYSLGVVLYELVTGAKPFTARNEVELLHAALHDPRTPVRARRPDTPPELERIIDRALERDRELRYPDCRVMHAALEQFIISSRQPVTAFQISELVQQAAVPDPRAAEPARAPPPPETEPTDPSRTGDFTAPRPSPPPPPPAEAEAPPPEEQTDVSLVAPAGAEPRRDTGPLPPPPEPSRTRAAGRPSRARAVGITVLSAVAVMGVGAGVLAARARREAPPAPPPRAAPAPRSPAEEARALLEKARPLLEGPSPELAEAPLLRCLELDRAGAECHLALGKLYARLKNEDGAAEHYLALLRLSPEHPRASEARAFLRDSAQLRYEQGRVLLKAKDYDEAKLRLTRCLELDPTFADCHVLLGAAYARLREPEKGAEQYRAYLRLLPDGDRAAEVKKLLQDYEAGAAPDGGAAHSP